MSQQHRGENLIGEYKSQKEQMENKRKKMDDAEQDFKRMLGREGTFIY